MEYEISISQDWSEGPVSGNCVSLILSTDRLMGAACRLGETVTADSDMGDSLMREFLQD